VGISIATSSLCNAAILSTISSISLSSRADVFSCEPVALRMASNANIDALEFLELRSSNKVGY
jgi:hypothetical protein